MAIAKIDVSLGALTFSGEGDEAWLSLQLDKLIQHAERLPSSATPRGSQPNSVETESQASSAGDIASMTLVAFLQKCDATSNQNSKFLATAVWFMAKQQKNTFNTKDVTGALTTAQQLKLNNPSQCLARVTKAGYVEKAANGDFYVTPEGRTNLKITS